MLRAISTDFIQIAFVFTKCSCVLSRTRSTSIRCHSESGWSSLCCFNCSFRDPFCALSKTRPRCASRKIHKLHTVERSHFTIAPLNGRYHTMLSSTLYHTDRFLPIMVRVFTVNSYKTTHSIGICYVLHIPLTYRQKCKQLCWGIANSNHTQGPWFFLVM